MISRLDKLKNLVNVARTQESFSWLARVETDSNRFEVRETERAIPTENVRRIYTVRARINEAYGRPIFGFEELLRCLANTNAEGVVIHLMEDFCGRQYFVFSDPGINELLGILGPLSSETDP